MNVLEVSQLSKVYQGKKLSKVQALTSVSFSVGQGEVFGFLGPNGAGKSTTIKCLMGLIKPTSGSARIMGEPVGEPGSRLKVGFLPENPAFYDYLSAEEYLMFVGKSFGMEPERLAIRCAEVLRQLDLTEAAKRPMRGYSKGMVQRVGLAQTLVHDPELYILDEPMSGLDPIGRALVKEIILDLKARGKSVFFSTHITDDVEKICDRVAVINKGELRCVESVENILERGVEGYSVTLTGPDGQREELYVAKEHLQELIQQSVAGKKSIEKIEPRRKDMEAFFLEIVAQ